MSIVTIDQLKEVEDQLLIGDKAIISKRLKLPPAIITQVIKYKHVQSAKAYPVYLAAKQLIEERENKTA